MTIAAPADAAIIADLAAVIARMIPAVAAIKEKAVLLSTALVYHRFDGTRVLGGCHPGGLFKA